MPTNWRVEVTGLRQVVNALQNWDASAGKRINKEITDAAKRVAARASELTPNENPLSNWGSFIESRRGRDLSFNAGAVRSNYKTRRNNFRRRGVSAGIAWEVTQNNAGGSMFAVIGNKSRVQTRSGSHLVDVINQRFPGKQPRVLIPAYYDVMTPELRDGIRQMIEDEAKKAGLV